MKRLSLLLPLFALALPAFAHDPAPNAPDSEDSIGATESVTVSPDWRENVAPPRCTDKTTISRPVGKSPSARTDNIYQCEK